MAFVTTLRTSALVAALAATAFTSSAHARSNEAAILIEADTGKVLLAENATVPWYPASVTKLMTTYVTLQAVKNGRFTLDTLFTVSARANAQQPTKMGFKPGTQVTIDNALKMLLVKSANDVAVVLAEGVSGSVEKFADEMNQVSRNLGMTQSNWVNPNGLPADEQITSARDLAILARALWHDFPEYDVYWHVPAIRFGKRVVRNYNTLIGRYEGADGMKTGFICASGFNLVASASRNGKRLIAVVLGSPSSPYRAAKAAGLLERGFNRGALSWLTPTLGQVESLQPVNAAPPDLREEMCGSHRKRPAAEEADEDAGGSDSPLGAILSSLPPGAKGSALLSQPVAAEPVVVYAGPAKKPSDSQFAALRAKLGAKLAKDKTAKSRQAAPPATNQPAVAAVPGAVPAAKPTPAAPTAAASTPAAAQTAGAQPAKADTSPGPFAPPIGHPAWMSFAPATRADSPPLTAAPPATPPQETAKPPSPRSKPQAKVAAKVPAKRKPAKPPQ